MRLPKQPGIYQIVNKVNQKRYIGYASNLYTRANGHLSDLYLRKHPNDYLQKAWNKYGSGSFEFIVLQLCEKDKLCLYEDYWVKVLKTRDKEFGYNIEDTDPFKNPRRSAETIEKMRKAQKGKPAPKKCREALAKYWKTHKMTEEHKRNQRESLKKVDWYKLRRDKRKPIFDRNKGIVYSSLLEASERTGIPHRTLGRKLTGRGFNDTNLIYL